MGLNKCLELWERGVTYINRPGGGVSIGGLGRVERQAVFGATLGK